MTTPPITTPAGDTAQALRHPATSATAALRAALDNWHGADPGYDNGASELADAMRLAGDSLDAKQYGPTRMVPACAYSLHGADATTCVEHLVGDERVLEFVCDEHLDYIRQSWTAAKDPAFAALNLAGMTTLPAYQVMPGMQTWTEASPLWNTIAWRFVILHTTTVRARDGQLRVRWTYQDVTTREFGFDEPVTGYFREPEPFALQGLMPDHADGKPPWRE